MVERGRAERGSAPRPAPAPGRARPRSGAPRARRPRGCGPPSRAAILACTRAELTRGWRDELGLDAVGVAAAEPYEETERHIRERRARGLFADMRFTMAQPEVSCHPETLLPGARTVVSAALCYWADGPEPGPGEGRLPRYTWSDRYAELRERLDALGRRLGGAYRVLVDANQHVDREAAARSGVGFYGKNTMLITRRHGSWVVLGTLVTRRRARADAAARRRLRLVHASASTRARPDALDEPGTLDATRCLSYWSQAPARDPGARTASRWATWSTAATSARTSARGTAASRSGAPARRRRPGAEPTVDLVEWLEADGDELVAPLRPALRAAQRPALAAPQRARRARERRAGRSTLPCSRVYADGRRRAARRARPLGARPARGARVPADAAVASLPDVDRWIARVRAFAVLFAAVEVGVFTETLPAGLRALGLDRDRACSPPARSRFSVASREGRAARPACSAVALAFDIARDRAYGLAVFLRVRQPDAVRRSSSSCVEGALRFGIAGGVLVPVVLLPYLVAVEWWRADRFGPPGFLADRFTFPFGVFLLTGLICGWLVAPAGPRDATRATRAGEAERLRDELGRRVDLLEAANRCARALASSLELDEAFDAFIREVAGVVPFDRLMVMRVEEGSTQIVSTAGLGADLFPAGLPADEIGDVLQRVLDGRTQVRIDLTVDTRPEEEPLVALGLRSRVVAPLQSGGRTIGLFSISRLEPDGVHGRGDRARDAARSSDRDDGAEHPRLRGGADDRRGAAPALRPSRRLRLDGLARAAQPDGGGDRLRPHAPAAVARAPARPARGVPGRDRRRDEPPLAPDRGRAAHVTDRGGDVLVPLPGGRRGEARARDGLGRGARPGRRAPDDRRGRRACPPSPRRSRRGSVSCSTTSSRTRSSSRRTARRCG